MLKGLLTPGRKKAEVFDDFGHRPMPHSIVVIAREGENNERERNVFRLVLLEV